MFNNSTNSFLFNLTREKPNYITVASILSLSSTILSVASIVLLMPLLFIILNGDLANIPADFSRLIRYYLRIINLFHQDYRLPGLIAIIFLNSFISIVLTYFSSIFSIKSTKSFVFKIKNYRVRFLA